jgi:hypothetical protein
MAASEYIAILKARFVHRSSQVWVVSHSPPKVDVREAHTKCAHPRIFGFPKQDKGLCL